MQHLPGFYHSLRFIGEVIWNYSLMSPMLEMTTLWLFVGGCWVTVTQVPTLKHTSETEKCLHLPVAPGSVTLSCTNTCLFLHSAFNACSLGTPSIPPGSLFCLWGWDMVILWPLIFVNTADLFCSWTLQGHPSNLHHIMATNVQMSIIRSSAPGPPLHIGASHLPRGKDAAVLSLPSSHRLSAAAFIPHLWNSSLLMQLFPQILKLLAWVSDCWPFKNYVAFSHLGQDHVTVFKMLADTAHLLF